jgi:serine/threonine protein phosphatase PrpC
MHQSLEKLINNNVLWPSSTYIVESHLEQGSGRLNEDVLLIEGETFGVFDGATSLDTNLYYDGMTGGLLAAQLSAQAFRNENKDLHSCMEEANHSIREAFLLNNPGTERHLLWSTSGAVVRLRDNFFSYCQTGDCLILLLKKDGNHTLITPATNHDNETLTLWKNSNVPLGAKIHDIMAEQIRKVRLQMNSTYGVLNGEPEAMDFICHGVESLENVSDILLFSDGLFLPSPIPNEEHDWKTFTNLYKHGGLQNIRNYIRTLEQQDPHLRTFPRFKQHDDIAAIALHFH